MSSVLFASVMCFTNSSGEEGRETDIKLLLGDFLQSSVFGPYSIYTRVVAFKWSAIREGTELSAFLQVSTDYLPCMIKFSEVQRLNHSKSAPLLLHLCSALLQSTWLAQRGTLAFSYEFAERRGKFFQLDQQCPDTV